MMFVSKWKTELRPWQRECFAKIASLDKRDKVIVAGTGAGKTVLALRDMHYRLSIGECKQSIVVVPSRALKYDWEDKAHQQGLVLDPTWDSSFDYFPPDIHGVVITYQSLEYLLMSLRSICYQSSIAVYFDEVHHLSEGKDKRWGNNALSAFEYAKSILSMSATPFRTDGDRIPFVEYKLNDDGVYESQYDYSYSYGRALNDSGVVRPIAFPSYDGRLDWIWNDQIYENETLSGEHTEEKERLLLRAALSLTKKGGWLLPVLKAANDELIKLRSCLLEEGGHPDAAGIIFAKDQRHAERIVEFMKKDLSIDAILAISDDKESHDRISEFRTSNDPWIVTVRMIGEGVDIPRLRIGVHATNVITEITTRQFIGRLSRYIEGIQYQTGLYYFPGVSSLIKVAQGIMNEVAHFIDVDNQEEEVKTPKSYLCPWCGHGWHSGESCQVQMYTDIYCPCEHEHVPNTSFSVIDYETIEDQTYYGDDAYSVDEIRVAEDVREKLGVSMSAVYIAQILRESGYSTSGNPSTKEGSKKDVRRKRKEDKSAKCQNLVGMIANRTGLEYGAIRGEANRRVGKTRTSKHFTIEQFEELERRLKELWRKVLRDGKTAFNGEW